jgi:hypothetical protein
VRRRVRRVGVYMLTQYAGRNGMNCIELVQLK